MKIRGTITNHLSDVIQTLSVARKTGVLIIEREDSRGSLESELGTITFTNGQVTDAHIGSLRGTYAYKVLSAWKTCRFIFQSPSESATSPPLPPQPARIDPQENAIVLTDQYRSFASPLGNIVPYRMQLLQGGIPDFQELRLSRTHRQLFLLIDGKRPVEVLTRLLGRNLQEVRVMLADLERVGLIHQSST